MQQQTDERTNRPPVSVYPDADLLAWIDGEAIRDGRSRTKQIEHFLKEARRVREHNQKAQADRLNPISKEYAKRLDNDREG